MARLAALGRAREQTLAEQAPHILGMTVAEHADRRGDFTQTVYFTSQEEARWFGLASHGKGDVGLPGCSLQDIAALTFGRDRRDLRHCLTGRLGE
jgi:hypothetical protein